MNLHQYYFPLQRPFLVIVNKLRFFHGVFIQVASEVGDIRQYILLTQLQFPMFLRV